MLLLTAAATRKVQRDGIQFASTRHVSPVVAAYVGEDVAVQFNPRDVGEIRVYFTDAFLCRAIAPELAADSRYLSPESTHVEPAALEAAPPRHRLRLYATD